jgi:hypothetical protein
MEIQHFIRILNSKWRTSRKHPDSDKRKWFSLLPPPKQTSFTPPPPLRLYDSATAAAATPASQRLLYQGAFRYAYPSPPRDVASIFPPLCFLKHIGATTQAYRHLFLFFSPSGMHPPSAVESPTPLLAFSREHETKWSYSVRV